MVFCIFLTSFKLITLFILNVKVPNYYIFVYINSLILLAPGLYLSTFSYKYSELTFISNSLLSPRNTKMGFLDMAEQFGEQAVKRQLGSGNNSNNSNSSFGSNNGGSNNLSENRPTRSNNGEHEQLGNANSNTRENNNNNNENKDENHNEDMPQNSNNSNQKNNNSNSNSNSNSHYDNNSSNNSDSQSGLTNMIDSGRYTFLR
jgi:hypothetical protein